jgi:hypothetical protein
VVVKMRKAHNLLWACMRASGAKGEVWPETEGGPQSLHRHRSADHLFRILSMVAWLSQS